MERAEQECLMDAEARERRSKRDAERRAHLDVKYVGRFATRVRELFPGCPPGKEAIIAEQACLRNSGRIGRTGAAKALDDDALRLAVIAHIRHTETRYDALLAKGHDRWEARGRVAKEVSSVLARWESPG